MQNPESLPDALNIIDNMQARIDALESALGQTGSELGRLRVAFGLSKQNGQMVALMSDGELKTYQQLYDAMNTGGIDWNPTSKIVPVQVVRIRKLLWPYGFDVETLWGHGMRLLGPLAFLRAVMAGKVKTLSKVREGQYDTRHFGQNRLFETTVAGRLIALLTEDFTPGETFKVEVTPLAEELKASPQAVHRALARLRELGHLTRLRAGTGWKQYPLYKLTKPMEKAA